MTSVTPDEGERARAPYRLAALSARGGEPSVLRIGDRRIGGQHFALIAGPCAVETREQTLAIAGVVASGGGTMLRGGAYKPRTSPYAFRGLGEAGLKILAEAKAQTGLPVVTELMDVRDLEDVLEVADMIQIGARNMQNTTLLSEVGRTRCPVMIKRGLASTIEELLMAAEYVLKEGNEDVVLCERGIRTFETAYRFTLDLAAVPVLKSLSHLPVVVDPSHAAGRRDLVEALSMAAAAAGADGIIVEIHPDPDAAICDGPQSVHCEDFAQLAARVEQVAQIAGKRLGGGGLSMVPVTAAELASGVRDRRIERVSSLTTPASLIERLPLGPAQPRSSCAGAPRPTRSCRAPTTACSSSSGRAASTTPTPRWSTPAG